MAKKRRSAAQKAATRKMLAANKRSKAGRRRKSRTAPKPENKMARRRSRRTRRTRRARSAAPAAPRRRRSRRTSRRRATSRRSGRRGNALVPMIVGTAIGGASAIGGATLLQLAANAAKFELPQVVKDFAPIAGAGVIALLATITKQRALVMPALIGGAAVWALNKFLLTKSAGRYGSGAYNRLRGSGNVARTLTANGAGNVARVLTANAVVR